MFGQKEGFALVNTQISELNLQENINLQQFK